MGLTLIVIVGCGFESLTRTLHSRKSGNKIQPTCINALPQKVRYYLGAFHEKKIQIHKEMKLETFQKVLQDYESIAITSETFL